MLAMIKNRYLRFKSNNSSRYQRFLISITYLIDEIARSEVITCIDDGIYLSNMRLYHMFGNSFRERDYFNSRVDLIERSLSRACLG